MMSSVPDKVPSPHEDSPRANFPEEHFRLKVPRTIIRNRCCDHWCGHVDGCVMMTASPASADTLRCMTRAEYDHVSKGMRKVRVHRIFDTRGTFGDGGGGYSRLYKECRKLPPGDGCWATVEYSVSSAEVARVAGKRWNGWCTNG